MTTPLEALLTDVMVPLPAGEIQLRDDRHKRVWTTPIAPFRLAKYQVTQALYEAATGLTPSAFSGPQRPVESVSWFDAVACCNALSESCGLTPCYEIAEDEVTWHRDANGYRLPTDAEWEYACRSGLRDVRYGPLEEIAWYLDNADETTHDVGQKQPSPWGHYDMIGNVWEWCWDLYDPEEYGSYRIFRGGGWFDPARGCLASNRRRSHPTYKIEDLGFRIAANGAE